jgi:hypothetical protein
MDQRPKCLCWKIKESVIKCCSYYVIIYYTDLWMFFLKRGSLLSSWPGGQSPRTTKTLPSPNNTNLDGAIKNRILFEGHMSYHVHAELPLWSSFHSWKQFYTFVSRHFVIRQESTIHTSPSKRSNNRPVTLASRAAVTPQPPSLWTPIQNDNHNVISGFEHTTTNPSNFRSANDCQGCYQGYSSVLKLTRNCNGYVQRF